MLSGFPTSKITPPRPRVLVRRERLIATLSAAADLGQIVLVVAPGGAGKTTLLADWVRATQRPVAWYALDTGDRDTHRLVAGLLAAIERAVPGITGEARTLLLQGAGDVAVIGMLLGALEQRPLTLVLDDFHRIDEAPNSLALWDQFFRFRPPSLTLVLLSRSVPLLGFASLAAMDALAGLGQKDLGFDAREADALLTAHQLPAHDAAHLSSRSGGWATGILLLARAGTTGMLQLRARQETLVEQFGVELLAGLPGPLRTFLLESAVLGPVTPSEADRILDRQDSALRFADAAARGLFLERLDGHYRYHDLIAEFLQRVLAAQEPARLHHLRARAAEYWLQQQDYGRTLAILAAAAEWPRLRAVLEQIGARLWESGLWGTIMEYVAMLPVAEQSLRLLELAGFAHAELGEYAEALDLADRASAMAASDEEFLRGALLAVQTLVLAGRDAEAIQRAQPALDVAQRVHHQRAIARLRQWRGRVLFHAGQVEEGRADLLAALALHDRLGDARGAALTCAQLASHLADRRGHRVAVTCLGALGTSG
jgi:LuxR family maltose regulon positive regulatory protein